jgi:hypothetical protein|nr:MAG TPA: hypothetical protein [Caudoviricetes sp.]
MGVQAKNLISRKGNRAIRKSVFTSNGDSIIIYEPTREDIAKIMEMQERWVQNQTADGLEFEPDQYQVIRELFPLLTDIEGLEDLTDEEIQELDENPNILFMQAAQVVQQIIAEVFSLIVLNYDKSIAESEAIIATNNSVLNTIQNTVIQASIEAGDPTLFDKINEEVEKEYEKGSLESLRSELAQTEKDLEAEKKIITVAPQDKKVDHIAKLAEFRKAFEEE